MNKFDNKTALVTGAGGGIGTAICKRLADQGASIIATDINADALQQTLDSLVNTQRHYSIIGNVQDPDFCDALPETAREHTGQLDIVVNNAGIIRRGKITASSDQDWHDSMSINVEAIFRICRAAIPIMQQQSEDQFGLRGSIVNLSSCWGLQPGPDHVVYCTSKAAVAAMTRCLARDHAPDGIRVNAVCPNEVDTPMLRTGFEIRGLDAEKGIAQLGETVPLGRVAKPEDVADAIAFLASNDARYICGELLEINGAKAVY